MRLLLLITLATALACQPFSSRAANLLNYGFDSNLDPEEEDGVTGSGFLASGGSKAAVGIGNGGNNSVTDGSNYAFILITTNSTSVSSAVSNAQFAQFTITPPAKNGMQLSQIQFIGSRGGNSTPRGVALRWSLDNYKANLGSVNISTTWPNTKNYTFNVNAFAGGPVTFRLYAYAQQISKAEASVRFNNLIVTGYTVIYPPTVTPDATNITTSKSQYRIKGTAYDSSGISRVEVAKGSPTAVYSGANGTTTWNYVASSLAYGKNVFYVRSIDTTGQMSAAVKVVIRRTGGPAPTPSGTP